MGGLTEADIRRLLREFIGDASHSVLALVKTVDETKFTCTLDDDGTVLYNVRLCPISGSSEGVVLIPEAKALVLAVKIEGSDDYMVVACTKVAKVQIMVGGQNLKDLIGELITNIKGITLNTAQGPTTGHVDGGAAFDALKVKFDKMFV